MLILYSTQIVKGIDPKLWKKSADTYYNDEGIFEYTYNGFTLITSDDNPLTIKWRDITKADSREETVRDQIRLSCIDVFFSDKDFITVNSSMEGFSLFEKRLKENLKDIWVVPEAAKPVAKSDSKSVSNLS